MAKRLGDKLQAGRTDVFRVYPSALIVDDSLNRRRSDYTQNDLQSFARSLITGQIHPITIRKLSSGEYGVVAGFRRTKAALLITSDPHLRGLAGLGEGDEFTLLAQIANVSDSEAVELNIRENIDRKDLSPIEITEAIDYLRNTGKSDKDIADMFHRTPAWVSQHRKLESLIPEVKEAVHERKVTLTAGMAIAEMTPDEQNDVLQETQGQARSSQAQVVRNKQREKGKTQARSLKEVRNFFKDICGEQTTFHNPRIKETHVAVLRFMLGEITEDEYLEKIEKSHTNI